MGGTPTILASSPGEKSWYQIELTLVASNGQTSFLQWKPTIIVTTQDSTYNLRALKTTLDIEGGFLRPGVVQFGEITC